MRRFGAMVGIIAKRSQFEVKETVADGAFDLFVCEDHAQSEVLVPIPFAVLCVDTSALHDAQELWDRSTNCFALATCTPSR